MRLVVFELVVLVLGAAGGYLFGKNSRPRAAVTPEANAPAVHEPPHAKYCHREDDVWHCEARCPWGVWKTELAMRGMPPPPGSRTIKLVK